MAKVSNIQMSCIKFCRSEGIFYVKSADRLYTCIKGKFVVFEFADCNPVVEKKVLACGGAYYRTATLQEFIEVVRNV